MASCSKLSVVDDQAAGLFVDSTAMSANGTEQTILAASQNVCFQG
jgi:hypothetical protein